MMSVVIPRPKYITLASGPLSRERR
jgi:hypothetical protein